MITLFQFPPAFGLLNASPYCMKVEVYLRLAKIPYQIKSMVMPQRAPRGKLPFIKDGERKIPDSSFIIEHLKAQHSDIDADLSELEQAQSVAWTRLVEEHLCWAIYYVRWSINSHWPRFRDGVFGHIPPLLRNVAANAARKQVLGQLKGQGLGRLTEDEIFQRVDTDIRAIATFLGEKPFMLGEAPHALDASVYATLANMLHDPFPSSLKVSINQNPDLLAYCARMEELLDTLAKQSG